MPVLDEPKKARPIRGRRWWAPFAVLMTLLVIPYLPLLTPQQAVRLGGYTYAAQVECGSHPSRGVSGSIGNRDRGVFECHVWMGKFCYRGLLLSPDGNVKWLL